MEYKRKQLDSLRSRVNEKRSFIQVVLGPRQIGKSTMIAQLLKDLTMPYTFVNADEVGQIDQSWIHKVWDSVRGKMYVGKESEHLLVIDEIQKVTGWSESVKAEWDSDTLKGHNIKVILLGSSRLMIQHGLTESLAGRFELIRMGHWSFGEMTEAFGVTLDEYIYFGGYPGAVRLMHDERRWRKYMKDSIIAPAIEKDALMTSSVIKPALLRQLFDLGCKYSSEELSLTKVVGQLQDSGNVTTLSLYLQLLNQCNLLAGLQKYAADDARKYNSIPKFCVYNNALLSALRGLSFPKVRADSELWGRWVESSVGAYLLSNADEYDYKVFYWRERNNEVDYIVQMDDKCIALEVKSGWRMSNAGVHVFEEKFHPVHTYIVGTGGIPLETFLKCNIEDLF